MEGLGSHQLEGGSPYDTNDETSEESENNNDQNDDQQDGSGFKCTKCDLCFRKKSFLFFHIITHTARKQYECERCDKKCKTLPELKKHKMSHKEQLSSTNCKYCKKTFSSASNLTRHMRDLHASQHTFVCPVCALCLPSEVKLKLHQSVHDGEVIGCDKCDKVIKISDTGIKVANYLMKRHQLSHKEKQFQCDKCSATFSRKDVHKKHILHCLKNDKKERPFPCESCSASFTRKDVLKRHIERCHKKKDDGNFEKRAFPCKKCNARFSHSGGLKNHMVKCHINQDAEHNEKDSDISKASSSDPNSSNCIISEFDININNDDNSNNGTTIYKCQDCMETFLKEDDLKTHKAAHTAMKSFKCDICSKLFSSRSNLRRHMLVHDKQNKPNFTCEICQTKFRRLSFLQSHWSLIHTDSKPHVCDECKAHFVRKSDLTRHTRMHNGKATLYSCDKCGMEFSRLFNLKRHKRSVYPCS